MEYSQVGQEKDKNAEEEAQLGKDETPQGENEASVGEEEGPIPEADKVVALSRKKKRAMTTNVLSISISSRSIR